MPFKERDLRCRLRCCSTGTFLLLGTRFNKDFSFFFFFFFFFLLEWMVDDDSCLFFPS
jgi:hypothetical protein